MEIILSNKLIIKNPTPIIKKWCEANLVLDNPEFYKKERLGKWTGNVPRSIFLYEINGDEWLLPFGCAQDIWKLCVRGVAWRSEICPKRPVNYVSHINLYPYQENAISGILERKNGVLVMPCGAGKTQCGLEVISRVSGRALWLTHTQDLLNQSKKRAEAVLDIDGKYGTITGGRVNIGTHITFATVQTMSRIDLSQYKDTWDIIIVDECQHCCGSPTRVTQFYKVISSLSARYKIGLTATPKRADGLEQAMLTLLGGIVHEVKREEIANTTCPVKVRQIETGWFPDCECVLMGDGTIDYHKVVENMTEDEERYKVVVHAVAKLSKPTIVLANRVEYLQRMNESMRLFGKRTVCISGMKQNKKDKEERKQILSKLNNGELDYVFATYQLAKEGLDVPNLRYIVFATPEKDETTVIQAVGRVGRKADGKDHGTVLDFVDDFGMYKGWAKKRASYYKKIGVKMAE